MKSKKEFPLLLIILIPFIYLAYIWSDLPLTVPTHWNWKGEIDDWGNKTTTLLIPVLLPLLTYLLFLIIPKIDPKKKIQTMGNKYHHLKFLLTLFMSALAMYILYSMKTQTFTNPNFLIFILGLFFIVLGNYMKTLKANYFIGIRTPWTLEHDSVWKKTHEFAGKLWFIGGLSIIISSLISEKSFNQSFFIITTIIITLIPVIYSYLAYKKFEKTNTI